MFRIKNDACIQIIRHIVKESERRKQENTSAIYFKTVLFYAIKIRICEKVSTEFPHIPTQERYKELRRDFMSILVNKHENAGIQYKHRTGLLAYAGKLKILKFQFDKPKEINRKYLNEQLSKLPTDLQISKFCEEEYVRIVM